MSNRRGFTQEFEVEAVRLALTGGQTRRALAENLGVRLSTLTGWIGRLRFEQVWDDGGQRRYQERSLYGRRMRGCFLAPNSGQQTFPREPSNRLLSAQFKLFSDRCVNGCFCRNWPLARSLGPASSKFNRRKLCFNSD